MPDSAAVPGAAPSPRVPTGSTAPTLASERRGSGPRMVLLHGFTQTRRCWGSFADDLAADHELVLLDAPGHGDSSEVVADLDTSALLSGAVGGRGIYLGYSMGGRTALHLALARPGLVERLILIGATGGLDTDEQRSQRRAADEQLAQRLESIGVERFVDEWMQLPLFAGLDERSAHREERLRNTVEGLARSLRTCGTGTQRPLWDELGALDMPVLVLAGEADTKFRDLGARLCDSIGAEARFAVVPSSGHSAQLENPEGTASIIRSWLDG